MNIQKHKQAAEFYYCPTEILGSGTWGTVYKARSINDSTQIWYALKKINKFKIESCESSFEKYKNEVLSLKRANRIPEVIKFVDFFKSKNNYYIVTEYEHGSEDLLSYMQKNHTKFTEMEARVIWTDLLRAIESLHDLKITHRDLKLQNILYVPEKRAAKLIDFGLATTFEQVGGRVGSIMFMSPQILQNEPYTQKSDIWSLGIVFYWMVCKCSPYGDNPPLHRIINVMKELDSEEKLPLPPGIYVSQNCEKVIKACLRWEEADRKPIKQILGMDFFKSPNLQIFSECLDFYEPELTFVN